IAISCPGASLGLLSSLEKMRVSGAAARRATHNGARKRGKGMRAGFVLSCTALVFAATASLAEGQKFEVLGDYSFIQYNPTVTGLRSRSFNGGGGAIQYNFGHLFGVKGDFQGYGSTNNSVSITSTPVATPAIATPTPVKYTVKSRANMFTYM